MTVSLRNSKLGLLPCSHKRWEKWLPLWPYPIFYSDMSKPISHSCGTHDASHTQTKRNKRKSTCHLCFVPEVHSEAIYHPVLSTGVGCSSDKLAWIKCQPWSRFTLTGATMNLLVWEWVTQIGAGFILSTLSSCMWDNLTDWLTDRGGNQMWSYTLMVYFKIVTGELDEHTHMSSLDMSSCPVH